MDKGRDREREKYENHEDSHGGRDRHRHSQSSRYDEKDYSRDRTRKFDPAPVMSKKSDSLEVGKDRIKRCLFYVRIFKKR